MEVKVDGFNVGTVVSLHYKVDADTKQAVMNFLSEQSGSADCIFHFNPRYLQKELVLNTRKGVSGWEEEVRPSGFPFEIDKEVRVTVEAESDGFLIKCDDHSFQYKFNYRMPVTNIHHIAVSLASGTLKIKNASYLGIVNPQSNKSIKDGDSVSLSVSSIQLGSQSLSFKWKKDNGSLTDTSKYTGVDGSNLKISSFSAEEQGNYSCIVNNGLWSVESGPAELALGKENENVTASESAIKLDDLNPKHHLKKDEKDVTGIKSTGPGIDKASASPKALADSLSPTDLVAWLSQRFQAESLTLEASLRQKLIEEKKVEAPGDICVPSSGKNTQEYQKVKKSFPKITAAIAGVIGRTSGELLAAGLITNSQKEKAGNSMKDAEDRASDLVSLILNKIDQDSRNFYVFVDTLKEDLDTFQTVLNNMGVSIESGPSAGSKNGASDSATGSSIGKDTATDYPCTSGNIEVELKEITQPYLFGLHLGVSTQDLEEIERNYKDVARQRSEVIKYWNRNNECTWEKVAEAVKKLGGHGKLEKKLRQLHTKGPHNSGSASARPIEDKVQVVKSKAPMKFSDNLSPTDLVAWLSQEFTTRGLTMDGNLKGKLIADEINGAAFKDLTSEELEEMGFKRGPRKNVMNIIKDLRQTDAEA